MMPPAAAPLTFSVLGYALRLAEPRALRLLAVVAVLALLGALALARRRRALRGAAGALAPRVAPGAGLARPAARLALSIAGLALLAVALARPQAGRRFEVTRRTGVDLAIVLDASRSMRARDVRPDRLARAKLELAALLDDLGGDRVAVVSFAGDAFVQCPLTTDLAAAKLFLRAVEPEAMPRQGTALAAALLAAKGALEAAGAGPRARVALVVSDGEDHAGGVASAARTLAGAGVRVFALAVGTEQGAPVPAGDPLPGPAAPPPQPRSAPSPAPLRPLPSPAPRGGGSPGTSGAEEVRGQAGQWKSGDKRTLADRRGQPVVSRLDAAALRMLADLGDGDVYDLVRPGRGLGAFRLALARLQRGDLEARVETTWEERYAFAALPGFLLLLAALLVREAPRVRARPGEAPA